MERRSFLETLIAGLAGSFVRSPASEPQPELTSTGFTQSFSAGHSGCTFCSEVSWEDFGLPASNAFVPQDPVVKSKRRHKNKKSHRRRRQGR